MSLSVEDRFAVTDFFSDYAACIDNGDLERWPELFVEDAFYEIIPRANVERGLPLGIMRAESRGMLQDRITAIRDTIMFEPRYVRHLISCIRPVAGEGGTISVAANYLVLETVSGELTKILSTGRYEAVLERAGDSFMFRELHCIYDSELVPNSIIYPI